MDENKAIINSRGGHPVGNKYSKLAKIVLKISIVLIIIGYFLWTILFPIQDLHTFTTTEHLTAQKQLALNYTLGRFLLYIGFTGMISSSI
ncbi:hypothetical protein SAMN04488113_1733 [Alkalibacterium gilvum]|uniref:Uncharacterized protein n=1 Tax=Alkalibacterium gilvum TaxID=1130080 RepID=A0A1H6W518_9LACT|nr:hypothetical protein SAMN04488113_1733 [Alkalibacterium gilvum]